MIGHKCLILATIFVIFVNENQALKSKQVSSEDCPKGSSCFRNEVSSEINMSSNISSLVKKLQLGGECVSNYECKLIHIKAECGNDQCMCRKRIWFSRYTFVYTDDISYCDKPTAIQSKDILKRIKLIKIAFSIMNF